MNPSSLIAWAYPLVFWTHIGLVGSSAALFVIRGIGVFSGQAWPMGKACRRLSVAIDSGLLLAGATLWWLLQLNPVRDHWLGVKLALLLVYIVLGSMALKRAPSLRAKQAFFAAALLCLAFMASIAIAHHPLGWLAN